MKSLVLAVAFLATALPLTALGQSPAAEESDRGLKPPKLKKFVEAAYPPGREAEEAKVLLSIEIMLNAAGLAFVVAGARWGQPDGQVMFVLILTTYADDEWLFDAIRSGASGYLLKDRPRAELVEAIKGTVAGEAYLDPTVAGKVLANVAQTPPPKSRPARVSLSPREAEILELLALGLSNADISQRLFLSEGTVRNYMSALFSKLGVSDRTQAVVVALREGLVDMGKL